MKNEKTNGAEPEMGYCPFEHWLGAGRACIGALGGLVLLAQYMCPEVVTSENEDQGSFTIPCTIGIS